MEQGTRNTCSLSGVLWEQGTGNKEQVSRAKRDAPQGRRRLNFAKIFFWGGGILKDTGNRGNREQGKCRVPQVFPEHVPEPFRENPSLGSENRDRGGIQWYSEPTSTPGPLLKININYEGC